MTYISTKLLVSSFAYSADIQTHTHTSLKRYSASPLLWRAG